MVLRILAPLTALALLGAACGSGTPPTSPDAGRGQEICNNGKDDNGDKKVDCADPQCSSDPRCHVEDCTNGSDDNANGLVDCEDPTCNELSCGNGCLCREGAKLEVDCTDGADNDGDRLADCNDPDCAGDPACSTVNCTDCHSGCDAQSCGSGCVCSGTTRRENNCSDGKDNDGDHFIDCDDPDCATSPACQGVDCSKCASSTCSGQSCGTGCQCAGTTRTEISCTDGSDNDGDGAADCADSDCANQSCGNGCLCQSGKKVETDCTDAIDNDGDALADCADSDCAGKSCGTGCTCTSGKKKETDCSNGKDDDGDTLVDCNDPDCQGAANCQGKVEICNDGLDNDGNRAIDCADSACLGSPMCTNLADGKPCAADAQCKDGKCLNESTYGRPNGECSGTCTTAGASCAGGGICVVIGGTGYCRTPCTCTGTACSNGGGCRAGFGCYSGAASSGNKSYCVVQCSDNSQCATSTGCNLETGYCEPNLGKKRLGEPCAADTDCESGYCLNQSSDGFPSGYCFAFCLTTTKVCPGDGVCVFTTTNKDNFAGCWDGCQDTVDCRSEYDCYSLNSAGYTSPVNACYPICTTSGGSCADTSECCSPLTCVLSGTAHICQ